MPVDSGVRHHREQIGDLRLHWVEEGEGQPVLLLHGFPEFWYAWRYQLPALADAGYRAVAPDLRGYNASDRPPGVAAYDIERLVDDVVGLARHLGPPVHLVGHDWGGVVAWRAAAREPELFDRLVVLNAPHPAVYVRALRSPPQLLRSWYVLFLQLPRVPEWVFRAFDYELVEWIMRRDIRRRDVLHETDFARYAEALSRPGALTAAIDHYRAAGRRELGHLLRRRRRDGSRWRVDKRTLLIWGERDRYLGPGLIRGLERWVPNLTVERIADASHWVQAEAHERVNQVMKWFLGQDPTSGPAAPAPSGAAPGA